MSIYATWAGDCDKCGNTLESSNGEVVGGKHYVEEMARSCGWEIVESDADISTGLICAVCRSKGA